MVESIAKSWMLTLLIATGLAATFDFNIWSYSTGLCAKEPTLGTAIRFLSCNSSETAWKFDSSTNGVYFAKNSSRCLSRGLRLRNGTVLDSTRWLSLEDCDSNDGYQRFDLADYFGSKKGDLKTTVGGNLCMSTIGGVPSRNLFMQPCQFNAIDFKPKLMVGFDEGNVLPAELRFTLDDKVINPNMYKQLSPLSNPELKFEDGVLSNAPSFLALVNKKLRYRSNPLYCVGVSLKCDGCTTFQLDKVPCGVASEWEFVDNEMKTSASGLCLDHEFGLDVKKCTGREFQKWSFE
jgi:hypothetical protein